MSIKSCAEELRACADDVRTGKYDPDKLHKHLDAIADELIERSKPKKRKK